MKSFTLPFYYISLYYIIYNENTHKIYSHYAIEKGYEKAGERIEEIENLI